MICNTVLRSGVAGARVIVRLWYRVSGFVTVFQDPVTTIHHSSGRRE